MLCSVKTLEMQLSLFGKYTSKKSLTYFLSSETTVKSFTLTCDW